MLLRDVRRDPALNVHLGPPAALLDASQALMNAIACAPSWMRG
jgi:hypothetical protein